MASVSSLDKDMRNIRLSRYTPQAANEVKVWIEGVLGERLAPGDLLEALKDGTTLCKLVNLVAPQSVRFKESPLPFVQMENISYFLRACQSPPFNLQSHDIFQTVDLYESKDPAQVLQCISAFSRRAHTVQPSRFPNTIGEKSKGGLSSPQHTGGFSTGGGGSRRPRGTSNTSDASSTPSYPASQSKGGRGSPTRSEASTYTSSDGRSGTPTGGISSWSKKQDEGATTPAWNIHQYGYMGGASQGNQGITFGGRRQITTPAPKVPSLAEKERKRREQESEAERLRQEAEEAERKRRVEREAKEERERIAEEQRWEEETRRQREQERLRVEEQKRQWEEEERRWKQDEKTRIQEEKEAEARLEKEKQQKTTANGPRPQLTGQFLSQYKAEQAQSPVRSTAEEPKRVAEQDRVKELERQLEEAKEREARYEQERQERIHVDHEREWYALRQYGTGLRQQQESQHERSRSRSRPRQSQVPLDREDSWRDKDERDYLRKEWSNHTAEPQPPFQPPRPLPEQQAPPQPPRPLPTPQKAAQLSPQASVSPTPSPPPITSIPPRPLPNPATYSNPSSRQTSPQRRSPFARPTPPPTTPSQPTTKPPAFAHPSSLLSREMELDRQRQQEWEQAQQATKAAASVGMREGGVNPGEGGWDTSQYGYLGGDSQNKVGPGIGFGGRRQLVGPREKPGKS